MDFGFSPEQEQLRQTVREFLDRETPVSYARTMLEDPAGFTESAWRRMAELGWLGLTIPEDYGGSGLGTLELALVAEAMGTVVLPGPFLSTVALGVPALQATADKEQLARLLPEVAAGRHRLTLAVAETTGLWAPEGIATVARALGEEFQLDGTKLFVPDAISADTIVVVARMDAELGFFALPRDVAGLTVEPMHTVDATRRLAAVSLASVRVPRERLLGGRAHDAGVLVEVLDRARTALAAELCGLAERALTMSVEYVKMREQFGRAIATFQAIQHRLADMKVDLENAKSLAYYAAWALDQGAPDRALAAAMAKAYASDACPRIIADAVQLHGGIGFTWEHDLHLYFKRAKADELTFGDATFHRELVASRLAL